MEANKAWLGVLLVVAGLVMFTPVLHLFGMLGCNTTCLFPAHMTVLTGVSIHAGKMLSHVTGSFCSMILPLGLVALGLLVLRRGRRDGRLSK